jgi:hypothetical protein
MDLHPLNSINPLTNFNFDYSHELVGETNQTPVVIFQLLICNLDLLFNKFRFVNRKPDLASPDLPLLSGTK